MTLSEISVLINELRKIGLDDTKIINLILNIGNKLNTPNDSNSKF